MRVQVREFRRDDLGAVQALWREAFGGLKPEDDADAIARLIARDPGALLVAEEDGRVVGAVIAAFDGRRGHVYRLAVHPQHRRRGLGAALLARGEERLYEAGAVRIHLRVDEANASARAFYRALGWEEQPGVVGLVRTKEIR